MPKRSISIRRLRGKLLLEQMVTTEYKLVDINTVYDDLLAGSNIRGVVVHEH